jgi:phage/conjugal plasmid C-4 type zinc finger TraR family protein
MLYKEGRRREEYVMAVGWSRDEAVGEQIDATVQSGVELAKSRLPQGESLTHCEECESEIPEARRRAMPGVRYCVKCQAEREKRQKGVEFYNRRGSKDSQLR